MTIIWRPAMSVGNDILDTDHRYLLCLVNTVDLALRTSQPLEVVRDAVEQLKHYTQEHFRREEKLMLAVRYLRYDHHKIAHGELIRELDEAARPILSAGDDTAELSAESRERLMALLKQWLLEHILREDLQMKPVLSEYPRNYSL